MLSSPSMPTPEWEELTLEISSRLLRLSDSTRSTRLSSNSSWTSTTQLEELPWTSRPSSKKWPTDSYCFIYSGKPLQRGRKKTKLQALGRHQPRRPLIRWHEIHQWPIRLRLWRRANLGSHPHCWRIRSWEHHFREIQQIHREEIQQEKIGCLIIWAIIAYLSTFNILNWCSF